jgi:hypothetical protein
MGCRYSRPPYRLPTVAIPGRLPSLTRGPFCAKLRTVVAPPVHRARAGPGAEAEGVV